MARTDCGPAGVLRGARGGGTDPSCLLPGTSREPGVGFGCGWQLGHDYLAGHLAASAYSGYVHRDRLLAWPSATSFHPRHVAAGAGPFEIVPTVAKGMGTFKTAHSVHIRGSADAT